MDRLSIIAIGGLLPAFAFGIGAIFQKGAMINGMGPGTYMVIDGLVMVSVGLALRPVLGETTWGGNALWLALCGGLLFALASGAISFAVQRLDAPISLIAPITVISTLVTVVLGFAIFSEHIELNGPRLLVGALLVVVGAAVVATS